MNSDLLTFIGKNFKTENRFFCFKSKYRLWSWSYNKIYLYAEKFSVLLGNLTINKGDKVILKLPNRPEWVVVYLGCLMRGVIVVPLDMKTNSDFDLKVLEKIQPKLLVGSINGKANFKKIKQINIDDLEQILSPISTGSNLSYSVSSKDLAEIVFTSGTVSEPKGVMITHRNIESNLRAVAPIMDRWRSYFRLMVNLRILSLVPLSHMYGQLVGVFIPVMIGGSVVFLDSLSPQKIIKTVKEERIWILALLPKFLDILRDYILSKYYPDDERFKKKFNIIRKWRWPFRLAAFLGLHLKVGLRLVAIMVGGAQLDSYSDEFWRCVAYSIFQGYGLTETSPLVTLADPAYSVAGSIGKVLNGQKIRLVNNEIYIKGQNVSSGYYKDSLETKKVFSDGWFKTGDLVEIDSEGNLFFKGRKDDVIIKSDGINVYPKDIESVIKSIDYIKDCAVVSLKYDSSEIIHAVLLLSEETKFKPEEIIKKANKLLNAHQHVDDYYVWPYEDFPRTSTMKIRKKEVVKKLIADRLKGKSKKTPAKRSSFKVYRILNSFKKVKERDIKPQAQLESDLGLDSLDIVQLTCAIEDKYNIEIDDSFITRETSVKDIENLIESPPKVLHKIPFYSFPYWKIVNFIRTLFQYFLYPFISILYRCRVYGRENLKEIKGPVVFAANHSSNLDTFVILYSLPLKIRKRVTAVMSIEHHFNNFFYHRGQWWRRFIEAIGFYLLVNLAISVCPLSRTHGFRQIMENIGKLIDKNWSILMFPEGGVTTDGKMGRFESGVGIIATDMKIPVVPVRIRGLYNILHNGILPIKHRPKWPLVTVEFGKPVLYKKESYKEVAKEIEKAVRLLDNIP